MNSFKLLNVKPIIQYPYYDTPSWMDENIELKEYVVLDADSSEHDVELFLIELLGYNDINIEQEKDKIIKDLLLEDEIAIAGGIMFDGESEKIFPGCCCGLESWREVLEDAEKKQSPWLGHDPFPGFEYVDDKIRIWSDNFNENNSNEIFFMEVSRQSLIEKLKHIEDDLIKFSRGPLYKYLVKNLNIQVDELIHKFDRWFSLDSNSVFL